MLHTLQKYVRNGLLNVANASAVNFKWKCSVTSVADGFSDCASRWVTENSIVDAKKPRHTLLFSFQP